MKQNNKPADLTLCKAPAAGSSEASTAYDTPMPNLQKKDDTDTKSMTPVPFAKYGKIANYPGPYRF
jgi:hypothetical protein